MGISNGPPKPTDSELRILNILWDRGPASVRTVHDELQSEKTSQYTTTLKLMQIMTEKGLVERRDIDRVHIYRPCNSRKETQRQLAGHLMKHAFGGSARNLLMGALDAKPASRKELIELRKFIDDHEKRSRR
jgi:BlaI family transcriptional regulator, penicillinase repressor